MADDDKNLLGMNFSPEHLKGSGTINEDGTYGDPLPDPTEVRGLGPTKTSGGRETRLGGLGEAPANQPASEAKAPVQRSTKSATGK